MAKKESPRARPDVIQRLREAKGWGQQALAERAVVSLKTINSIEQGKGVLLGTIGKIAKSLGVEPSALLEGHEDEVAPESNEGATRRRSIDVQLKLSIPFDDYDECGLGELLRIVTSLVNAKHPISVVDVSRGSVVLTLSMSEDDFEELVTRFCAGSLDRFSAEELVSPLQRDLKFKLEQYLPRKDMGHTTAAGKEDDFAVEYKEGRMHIRRINRSAPPTGDDG
jgi:transcriptional regulator with XRE-family HTH domain